MIKRYIIQFERVTYGCDFCGDGDMCYSPELENSDVMKRFRHVCDNPECKHVSWLNCIYPHDEEKLLEVKE